MDAKQAKALAEKAVDAVTEGDWIPVAGTVNIGMSTDGSYWIADNGEESSGLSRDAVIAITVDALTEKP